jgi:hypothetical protein
MTVNTDINTKRILFDSYFLPSAKNKNLFFNVYNEKFTPIGNMLLKELPDKYIEFVSSNPIKRDIITRMNNILGIEHSCQPFTFIEDAYQIRENELKQIIPYIDHYFGITSTSQNHSLAITNRLIKMYESWCDVKIKRERLT